LNPWAGLNLFGRQVEAKRLWVPASSENRWPGWGRKSPKKKADDPSWIPRSCSGI